MLLCVGVFGVLCLQLQMCDGMVFVGVMRSLQSKRATSCLKSNLNGFLGMAQVQVVHKSFDPNFGVKQSVVKSSRNMSLHSSLHS